MAGGAPIRTEFGDFRPPNITSHREDGIGAWTIADFARALRHGESPQGAPYYPAFPYDSYTGFSDQDVADLWAAFGMVPPVAGGPEDHDLDFPWSIRSGLALWRALYFEPKRFVADSTRSPQWNRGAFIAEVAGHCGACHTPRTALGGPDENAPFAGGLIEDGRRVPAITAQSLRAKGWDEGSLALALKTGLTPSGDAFGRAMADVVREGTRWLSEEDRQAIATYLLDD